MQIGIIGLGRMGQGLAQQLIEKGYQVVGYDIDEAAVSSLVTSGGQGASSVGELITALAEPRLVWVMVQRGVVQTVLDELKPMLAAGDTIIEGGNTFYKDSITRARAFAESNVGYLDVGVSGGVSGARSGASMMIGGDKTVFDHYEQVFKDLCVPSGYGYMGRSGAGHFAKMVHNGIEYGMLSAVGEGMQALKDHQEEFDMDISRALSTYQHGSIISSQIINWLSEEFAETDHFKSIVGSVPRGDSEEEMEELVKLAAMPVLETALKERKRSREEPAFAFKVVAAIRHRFGGHKEILE